jgi:hypothetical protein
VDQGSRGTALLFGAVAAAAGIAVVSYLFYLRHHTRRDDRASLRPVADVLNEVYERMREVRHQLAELPEPAN